MNKNLLIYCLTLNPDHLSLIKKIGYSPVGLGSEKFSDDFLTDNKGDNISNKNKYYGEYTFHYFLWKNHLPKIKTDWIGFCQYRKFWTNQLIKDYKNLSFENFNNNILKDIPKNKNNYDTIIGEPFFVDNYKYTKLFKKALKKIILNPSILFRKRERNLKFHFDLFHGEGNIEKAILLVDPIDREDFSKFIYENISFNPHNMFICRSVKTLKSYYESVFPWLERCEKEFGFNLEGYGMQRIYGFLAERYMSFWFKKYTNFTTLPIQFKDITDFNND